jgi:FkbM family methyltransferase
MLDVVAQYELNHIKFGVPLYRIPWDFKDLANYEACFVDVFSRSLARLQEVTLFDCGADIGTFSALLCARSDRISRIIAFEPNPAACAFLEINLSNVRIPFQVIPGAVSCFEGRGRLERSQSDPSDHARFLVPGSGPISVTTIDGLGFAGGDVAIKVDLEGGELDALKGASKTIAAARNCVVGLEANPTVKRRTGCDPVECLEFLKSVRPFQFIVAETGECPDISTPILKEGQADIWNVVGWSYDLVS